MTQGKAERIVWLECWACGAESQEKKAGGRFFRGLGFQAKEIWFQIAVTWELLIWTTRAQKEETTCLELLMFREQVRQGEEKGLV